MAAALSDVGWFSCSHVQDKIVFQSKKLGAFGVGNLAIPGKARRNNMSTLLRSSQSDSDLTVVIEEETKSLAETWKEIHGENDWEAMLDPIKPLMKSELIRYGDMAQACYDAFDQDPCSKYCGGCQLTPDMFFEGLGLSKYGYDVTTYLYSAYNINLPIFYSKSLWPNSWSNSANWSGYVAVSNDETSALLGRRDITIAWRGTVVKREWLADMMDFLRPVTHRQIDSRDPSIRVEAGFLQLYTDKDERCKFSKDSARDQVLAELSRLIQKYENEEMSITITGHSLGSALAILNAYDIAETGVDLTKHGRDIPVCVFSFSGPRVGNGRFKERLEGLGVKVLRVVNIHDKVPYMPGVFFNEHVSPIVQKVGEMSPWCYSHVGEELALDHENSTFLKKTNDLGCCHNLEALLHLIDGYHGKGKRFWLSTGRDIALVNKSADFLKDDYSVPPNWWGSRNTGPNGKNLDHVYAAGES
ncbi:phospholipase A1-Igamma2, chloroplastic-like [Apium graveolens]|uniref:phospholipase A1-Igamma2, chloroplastic-like n=1 Tax=Apium graveolens TaxID=4045 RepID=UPI003D78EE10